MASFEKDGELLQLLREKLTHHEVQEASVSDPSQKFMLRKQIEELRSQISDLEWPTVGQGRGGPLSVGSREPEAVNVYVTRLEISNIRCIPHLAIDFPEGSDRWVMFLGNNASGKTTLLRSLALGLCNALDAAAMIKDIPGNVLQEGASEGFVEVHMRRSLDGAELRIRTSILRDPESGSETIQQDKTPARGFPWNDIFVCGYGTQRSAQARSSSDHYSPLNALRTLFSDQASLQNPEVVLLRQSRTERRLIEQRLLSVLMLDESVSSISSGDEGLTVRGPWGTTPLFSLSDGYRSTAQWVIDYIGWQIHADRFDFDNGSGGILLIDELEQHLHPRWQRQIVQRLRRQFPTTQIFSTTHTPLVAAGVVDLDDAMIVRLEKEDEEITAHIVDKEKLKGKRADQILASEAFGLVTSRTPGSTDDLNRYVELLNKDVTEDEREERDALAKRLEENIVFGENEFEQTVERAVRETLEKLLGDALGPEHILETKRQLSELFHAETSE